MTVATLNPFDLLNEDLIKKNVTSTKTAVKTEVKPVATTNTNAKATTNGAKPAAKPSNDKRELNANVTEKTPLRRGNHSNRRSENVNGNERQERRRTDRHSRTGYKQDGEKRLTSGKGSWGKAVEAGEEHVTVDESVAVAEQIESIELEKQETEESAAAVAAEPVVPHLTLAQYQASLKKPVLSATNSTRKVTTTLPADQIVKKETEVFVFPEIVKKSTAAAGKKSVKATESAATSIDVTKYISVKAVSSVEPRERSDRNNRSDRSDRNNRTDRNSNNRTSRNNNNNNNNRTSTTSSSTKSMNLKDERSFPTLSKN